MGDVRLTPQLPDYEPEHDLKSERSVSSSIHFLERIIERGPLLPGQRRLEHALHSPRSELHRHRPDCGPHAGPLRSPQNTKTGVATRARWLRRLRAAAEASAYGPGGQSPGIRAVSPAIACGGDLRRQRLSVRRRFFPRDDRRRAAARRRPADRLLHPIRRARGRRARAAQTRARTAPNPARARAATAVRSPRLAMSSRCDAPAHRIGARFPARTR